MWSRKEAANDANCQLASGRSDGVSLGLWNRHVNNELQLKLANAVGVLVFAGSAFVLLTFWNCLPQALRSTKFWQITRSLSERTSLQPSIMRPTRQITLFFRHREISR